MNITFLIGNGFDINIGLKTKYSDFYKYYLEQETQDEKIKVLKQEIKEHIENWSDLELALGKYTERLESEQDAIFLYNNLQKNLTNFIVAEENKYDFNSDNKELILKDLIYPEKYLRPVEGQLIRDNWKKEQDNWYVNIITFNYTFSLEKLINFTKNKITISKSNSGYERSFNVIEHIHGYSEYRMILGVNDSSQIANSTFRDSLKVTRRYVKSTCNNTYGLGHEKKCMFWIETSSIICLYGLSLGDTDKKWWINIGTHLSKSNAILIIFYYDNQITQEGGPDYEDRVDEIKDLFLDKTNLTKTERTNVLNRIFVSFSKTIFNVKISPNGK